MRVKEKKDKCIVWGGGFRLKLPILLWGADREKDPTAICA